MTRTLTIFLAAIAFCPPASPLRADTGSSVKSSLQALYDRENAAAAAKDVQGTLAYVATDFKGTTSKGQEVTYEDLVETTSKVYGMASSIHAETAIGGCNVTGKKATVGVSDTLTIVIAGQGGQDMTLVDQSTSIDTWTKTTAGWRMTTSKGISHSATVDGQPAPDLP